MYISCIQKLLSIIRRRNFKSGSRNEETRRAKKKEEEKRSKKNKTKEQEEQVKQAQAAEQPTEGSPQEINENAQLNEYLQNAGFSGTAVIVKNGKVLLNKGYGMANKEQQVPNNSETTFILVLFQRRL